MCSAPTKNNLERTIKYSMSSRIHCHTHLGIISLYLPYTPGNHLAIPQLISSTDSCPPGGAVVSNNLKGTASPEAFFVVLWKAVNSIWASFRYDKLHLLSRHSRFRAVGSGANCWRGPAVANDTLAKAYGGTRKCLYSQRLDMYLCGSTREQAWVASPVSSAASAAYIAADVHCLGAIQNLLQEITSFR